MTIMEELHFVHRHLLELRKLQKLEGDDNHYSPLAMEPFAWALLPLGTGVLHVKGHGNIAILDPSKDT
jgi:hypothetical protein